MLWPNSADAMAWLADQGVAAAAVFLRAAGGRPDDALALAQSDLDPSVWAQLPQAVARGEPGFFKDWPMSQVAHTLHKICHDVLALHVGAAPLFFEAADLPQGASIAPLTAWAQALSATLRKVEHPFHPGLMLDALLSQAQLALQPTQL
jgi:DNA polymerase-3 subunit delta'